MKSILSMSLIILLLGTSIFNNSASTKEGTVKGTLLFETDAITQQDYDNNFKNYADKKSTYKCKKDKKNSEEINLVGIVKDYDSEEIIRDAEVELSLGISVRTDKNGRFQIINCPAGIYDWKVSAKGYYGAQYEGYDLSSDETIIITLFLSKNNEINYNRKEYLEKMRDEQNQQDFEHIKENNNKAKSSLSAPPSVDSSIGVYYNGSTHSVGRQVYIYTVISSELYSSSIYASYGMTNYQIKQLFIAQAVASNTFLEYALKVYSPHTSSGYRICNSNCCQVYDPTLVYMNAVDATAEIFYYAGGVRRTNVLMYHPTSNSYDYIWGAFFSSCGDNGTLSHAGQPALVGVSCHDLFSGNGGHRKGMCQMGAAYLASIGYSAGSILNYYYTDCTMAPCPII